MTRSNRPSGRQTIGVTAQIRLVACVDLVDSGKRVRSCKFDEPKDTIPLREGIYRLSLYEVATGKKLAEKRMTGENDDCPFVAYLVGDRTLYSEIDNRQLYETLRRYVQK